MTTQQGEKLPDNNELKHIYELALAIIADSLPHWAEVRPYKIYEEQRMAGAVIRITLDEVSVAEPAGESPGEPGVSEPATDKKSVSLLDLVADVD